MLANEMDAMRWVKMFERFSDLGHPLHESMILADAELALDGRSVR